MSRDRPGHFRTDSHPVSSVSSSRAVCTPAAVIIALEHARPRPRSLSYARRARGWRISSRSMLARLKPALVLQTVFPEKKGRERNGKEDILIFLFRWTIGMENCIRERKKNIEIKNRTRETTETGTNRRRATDIVCRYLLLASCFEPYISILITIHTTLLAFRRFQKSINR